MSGKPQWRPGYQGMIETGKKIHEKKPPPRQNRNRDFVDRGRCCMLAMIAVRLPWQNDQVKL
jgi:hypothetical protein